MKFTCFQPIAAFTAKTAVADRIDKATGLIKGVRIISTGAARGHGVLVDDKSLSTVKSCAEEYGTGLKVKFNPDTFNHGDGSIAGLVPKATLRIENGALLGDLQLRENYAQRAYILELAETQADTFGLSIDFSGDPETINGIQFARCNEIYAVTIVDEPAANDAGLFSAKDDPITQTPNTHLLMSPEDKKEFASLFTEGMKPFATRLDSMEDGLKKLAAKPATNPDDEDADCTGMSAADVATERLAAGVGENEAGLTANRKVHAFRKTQAKPATVKDIVSVVRAEMAGFAATTGNRGVTHNLGGRGGNEKQHAFATRIAAFQSAGTKNRALAILRAKADDPKGYEQWEADGRPMPEAAK